MNILFITSSEFSIPCLNKITNSEHQLVGIVTRPDKPEGRGRKIKSCIIKEYAARNNIKCFDPVDLKDVSPTWVGSPPPASNSSAREMKSVHPSCSFWASGQ